MDSEPTRGATTDRHHTPTQPPQNPTNKSQPQQPEGQTAPTGKELIELIELRELITIFIQDLTRLYPDPEPKPINSYTGFATPGIANKADETTRGQPDDGNDRTTSEQPYTHVPHDGGPRNLQKWLDILTTAVAGINLRLKHLNSKGKDTPTQQGT